jgi:hypothetical protein
MTKEKTAKLAAVLLADRVKQDKARTEIAKCFACGVSIDAPRRPLLQ